MSRATEFFKEIGIKHHNRSSNPQSIIRRRLKSDSSEELLKIINERKTGSSKLTNLEFYSLKNSSLSQSLAFTEAFESDYLLQSMNWIDNNIDLFQGNILEIGCDIGIVSCFLARLFPGKQITAIDLCTEAIANAKELAARLRINNISFICIGAIDVKSKYDTVLTMRTLHENHSTKQEYPICSTLLSQGKFYRNLMRDYAKTISKVIASGGKYIAIEKNDYVGASLGWMMALQENNIGFTASNCYRYATSDSQMIAFVAKEGIKREIDDLFIEYDESFKTIDLESQYYIGEEAALMFQKSFKETIFCLSIKDTEFKNDVAMLGVFSTHVPSVIMIYHVYFNGDGQAPNFKLHLQDIAIKDIATKMIENEAKDICTRIPEYKAQKFMLN